MERYEPLRAALAEQAARRGPRPVLPRLRLLTTAELLCPAAAPARALDLDAELAALCEALGEAVRRRPGWLYLAPAEILLPVAVRPRLLQAALLCFLREVLKTPDARAVIGCRAAGRAAVLTLRGGAGGGDTPALLRALAAEAGGCAVVACRSPFAAAVRLPLSPAMLRPAVTAAELLADRCSLLYVYLSPYCAMPE